MKKDDMIVAEQDIITLDIDIPFSVSFVGEGKEIIIKLKQAKDTLKLADIFTDMLDTYKIQYEIKKENQL